MAAACGGKEIEASWKCGMIVIELKHFIFY